MIKMTMMMMMMTSLSGARDACVTVNLFISGAPFTRSVNIKATQVETVTFWGKSMSLQDSCYQNNIYSNAGGRFSARCPRLTAACSGTRAPPARCSPSTTAAPAPTSPARCATHRRTLASCCVCKHFVPMSTHQYARSKRNYAFKNKFFVVEL